MKRNQMLVNVFADHSSILHYYAQVANVRHEWRKYEFEDTSEDHSLYYNESQWHETLMLLTKTKHFNWSSATYLDSIIVNIIIRSLVNKIWSKIILAKDQTQVLRIDLILTETH